MQTIRVKHTSILWLFGMTIIFYACQKADTDLEDSSQLKSPISAVNAKNNKIDVCHNDHVINISINAVSAHQQHGDAVDMDGDGYFDLENSCGETDCDDSDPEIYPDGDGSCDSGMNTAELLIGTWETTGVILETAVGSMSVIDYLVDVVGLSPADAAVQLDLLEASLIYEVTVLLTINADNTYASSFGGGSDSGTWSLSADGMTLTMYEGTETIIASINSISETSLNATLSDDILFDLDSDPGTPDVVVSASAILTMVRV